MDKQMIEEMAKVMANWAYRNGMHWHGGHARYLCEALLDAGYRKIPEGAVVLEKPIYDYIMQGNRTIQEHERKETADKFAKRLKKLYTGLTPVEKATGYTSIKELLEVIDEIAKEITEVSDVKTSES